MKCEVKTNNVNVLALGFFCICHRWSLNQICMIMINLHVHKIKTFSLVISVHVIAMMIYLIYFCVHYVN